MAQNPTPLINGVRHAWASIRINMLGRTIDGVTSINYGDDQDKKNNYGGGSHPNHRSYGNFEPKADVTLYQFEVVGIQNAIPGKRIQSIPPFDIVVTYLPVGQDTKVVDIIRDVEFLNNDRDLKQGQTMSEVPLKLIIGSVNWGGIIID